ncbi:hypothetical protein KBA73_00010 [Patescibacteria group bacterium]|nr:hypothetical protein [Patescibacteria group bacterium]
MLEKGSRNATSFARALLKRAAPFVVAFLFLGVGFAFGPEVAAQVPINAPSVTENVNIVAESAGIPSTDLPTIIGRIIYVFLGVVGIVLLIMILYAGFLWMTAAGDAKQVQEAKDRIQRAIIGLLIIASAFAITRFIMSQLFGATGLNGMLDGNNGGGQSVSGGFPGSAGSLGSGRVRDVYPLPGTRGVPRNTSIMITFSEPVRINSFVRGYDDHGTPADLTDDTGSSTTIGLNADVVKIYATADGITRALNTSQVYARFTPDRQTFVFRPIEPLGSEAREIDYTVKIMGGVAGPLLETCALPGGCPLFEGAFSPGYTWQFQTSRTLDLTPPRVVSAVPFPGREYAPNIVVQLNFNEAIDPSSIRPETVAIQARPLSGGPLATVDGHYAPSNGYRTLEFITNVGCGINSCGRQVFCLPASSTINLIARAATLSSLPPQATPIQGVFDGIVDSTQNSLDGNSNATAEGPPADNYSLSFTTSDRPNLEAPSVREFTPEVNASDVAVDSKPTATFDSLLQASTIITSNVKILTNETNVDAFWWVPRLEVLAEDGRIAENEDIPARARIRIEHRVYDRPSRTFLPEYDPSLLSGIQNIYQNCFNPATYRDPSRVHPTCVGSPNCCGDLTSNRMIASNGACPYPVITPRQ